MLDFFPVDENGSEIRDFFGFSLDLFVGSSKLFGELFKIQVQFHILLFEFFNYEKVLFS